MSIPRSREDRSAPEILNADHGGWRKNHHIFSCFDWNSSAYINCPNEYKCPNGSKLKNFLLPKIRILRFWIATSGHFLELKINITHYPWVYPAVGRVEGTREVKERELEGFSLKMFPAFAASFTIP